MVNAECLCRVLHFEVANSAGSCFSYERNNHQFFITAKHIFDDLNYPNQHEVSFFLYSGIKKLNVYIYYHSNCDVDIAVMDVSSDFFLTKTYLNQQFSSENIIWGQDIYFLGFPFYFHSNLIKPQDNNPVPFIKKACFSGIVEKNGIKLLLLDGINNPGFSGGPVCFHNLSNKQPMAIAGVINAYECKPTPLFDNEDKELPYHINENTGIIFATDINYALEIINTIP